MTLVTCLPSAPRVFARSARLVSKGCERRAQHEGQRAQRALAAQPESAQAGMMAPGQSAMVCLGHYSTQAPHEPCA